MNWRALCEELLADYEQHLYRSELVDRARAALAQPEPEVVGAMQLPEQSSDEHPPSNLDRREVAAWYHGHGCGWQAARAAIARWGRPAPEPAGEVGELVAWLRERGKAIEQCSFPILANNFIQAADLIEQRQAAPVPAGEVADEARYLVKELRDQADDLSPSLELFGLIHRAADLLEQRQAAPVPVAVSERLPESGVKVLAHYFNDLGKGRTICAIWVPAKSRCGDYGYDDFTEYDEETDSFYWPEGWYEAIENWDDLGWVKVDEGEVIYWQPLPRWPANALPLPSGEVE